MRCPLNHSDELILVTDEFFSFWTKTIDYNYIDTGVLTEIGVAFVVILFRNGRYYEAEIYIILLRYALAWHVSLPGSTLSVSGRNPWHFDQMRFSTHNSSLEGATELKFAPLCSSKDVLSLVLLKEFFAEIKLFSFSPKAMDYNQEF